MPTVQIHDVPVPRLGFGTWELSPADAERSVRDALELGYRHVDTAQLYANEDAVGRAIAASGIDRDHVFVTTKVWRSHAAARDVVSSTEDSLRRLGMDHVDLLLLHWPNDAVPLEETLGAMTEVRDRSWTRLIGVSNFPSGLLRRAVQLAPIAVDQVEYHPFLGQRTLLATCAELDVLLTAYSPLAHGEAAHDATLREIGAAHGRTAAQVALRWLLDQPHVAVLPRSARREHIAENADLDFELSDADRARIAALPKDHRKTHPPFAPAWDPE